MAKSIIAIDVGGTNVKLGLVNGSARIISRKILDTRSYARNKTSLISALVHSINEFIAENKLTKKNIAGIGIGLPGLIDPKRGVVMFLPNIPGWRNVPLKKILQEKVKIPIFIDNDVNVITLGEWHLGAGKGVANLICMTLGTGVGSGIVLNGQLYRGKGFVAGELGHMPLNEKGPKCNCGGEACFERYVGNQTLSAKASKIFKMKNMRTQDVFALANQGNVRAIEYWKQTAIHIGNGLVGAVNLLNPEMIIIGGGVANNYKYMGKTIKEVINKRAMKVQSKMVKIVRSKLGDDAGILGAYQLVKEGKIV